MAQSKIDSTRVDALIEKVENERKTMKTIIEECKGKMTELDGVYKSDASEQFKITLDKTANDIDTSVDAIINSLKANAAKMVADYQAQDAKNAESTVVPMAQ